MSAEARQWLVYARENRQVAALCRDSGLFNPSLQNAQQAVEKALKAMGLACGLPLKRPIASANSAADYWTSVSILP